MRIVGSVIARAGSKRLPFKNLFPYKGEPLVLRAVKKLIRCGLFSNIVLSTDCELTARTCREVEKLSLLKRPDELATDEVGSIPVFQHIVENFPCDIHLNYNCNFPECSETVFSEAISIAQKSGEALSEPYAVWAQSKDCLENYGDPFKITAKVFQSKKIHPLDIHTYDDLLNVHQENQKEFTW